MTLLPMHKEKLGAMISLAAKYGFMFKHPKWA